MITLRDLPMTQVGTQVERTKTCEKTLQPTWDEVFEFPARPGYELCNVEAPSSV